jgi:nickel/cobalt exporter
MSLALALVGAAVGIGAVHTCAPDHWVPFAALSRAEGWSARRTAAITAACGLGHVTVSVALGLLALLLGREVFQLFGERLESVSGLLLIGFGVAYAAWSLRHRHHHHHGVATSWTLFLLFSADPCVAVIPLIFASAPLGWAWTLAVVVAYELATIGTMVVLVLPARAAAAMARGAWADRYGDALAGGVVALVGFVVIGLGI